jgi:PhnB protein
VPIQIALLLHCTLQLLDRGSRSPIRCLNAYSIALPVVDPHPVPPGGKILHAEISICGSVLMISDPTNKDLYAGPRSSGRTTASLHIFVDNNQALLQQAIAAGAEEIEPPTDMFYGANSASLRDPFGHVWVLLSWKEDIDPAEIERRGKALLSK